VLDLLCLKEILEDALSCYW